MNEAARALVEMKDLYANLMGQPAPEIAAGWYAPFPSGVDPLRFAMQEVEDLKQLAARTGMLPRPVAWIPRADLYAASDVLVIRLEIPGVGKDDLKVCLAEGNCVIRGERKPAAAAPELRPLGVELAYGPFERRFVLPRDADTANLTARYGEGILEVRIPVLAAAGEKDVTVEVA